MALVSADTKIAELLTELHQLIKQTQEERSRSEHNLLNIQKTHERMQTENKTSPYYRTKLRGLYTTAKADAEAECSILRHALEKIKEIKSLLEERRIAVKMAGVYNDSDPPRKTMRRGVLMTLLQQSAMTLPLWIGKPGESPPPLCGAIPASSDYVAKQGDKVAARVKAMDGDEQWILAEVVSYNHSTNKYEVDDIDEEGKERHTLSRRRIIPLPQWKANPETDPEALFSKDQLVLALYPQTTCFYRALIHTPPHRAHDSDSDVEIVAHSCPTPPRKRRRVLDPSAGPISYKKVTHKPPVKQPLYNQVDCTDVSEEEKADLWHPSPPKCKHRPITINLSDSEEETEQEMPQMLTQTLPSPPPPCRLPSLNTTRSSKRIRRPEGFPDFGDCRSQIHNRYEEDNNIIINDKQKRTPAKPKHSKRARKISLKIRWRMDVHKIPVLSTDPLSKAVAQLSVKLKVPPTKIVLMKNDDELHVHSTITQLDLSIADTIDCLVIADDKEDEISCDVINLRLQGKEKGSEQEYSIDKDAPLGSILSQYTSGLPAAAKRKVKFLFDGLKHFWALLLTRGFVGVGEASYSTIAPTIIADLFVKEKRTIMLSVFYFAIPVGSGLGYIVGSAVDKQAKDWHWALRVTPALGLLAVVLLLCVVKEPNRGAVEARPEHTLHRTSWLSDMKALFRNKSFVLSTFGFTAVAFVTGSLALWAPAFLFRAAVFTGEKQPCIQEPCDTSDSLYFGVITCVTGVLGVAMGVGVSKSLRTRTPRADPLVCAAGLLLAAPFLYLSIVFAQGSTIATYVFIFFGEMFLSMNWAIVADILLYVVVPTRRSTAEAFQIVLSHLLGDAGSPYLIGVVSDSLKRTDSYMWQFRSLQLSLLLCSFVAVVGGGFFLATALFVEKDRHDAENYVPSDDAPIIVPKRGRSTKVPVSSVL
ncbi:protein spinster 1, partial [Clarias magur]